MNTSCPRAYPNRPLLTALPEPGLYASPGWVDLQVNGFAGWDINALHLSAEAAGAITRVLFADGVTAWCPTLITASAEQTLNSLKILTRSLEEDRLTRACVPGFHLEGPYISAAPGTHGAHPRQFIRPPDWEEFQRFQEAAGGMIRIVTLAPEQPGAIRFIAKLAEEGVIPAIGHSMASTAEIHAAVQAGARLATHLGNGIAATLSRHPNPIWDQLAEDNLFASFIFDGFHLPAAVMKVLLRVKGVERSILVSDSTMLARLKPGVYDTPVGGKVELHPSGRLSIHNTEYLAGSASSLREGLENALKLVGNTPEEGIRLVTSNPSGLLAWEQDAQTLFRISPDGDISIRSVSVNGTILFSE